GRSFRVRAGASQSTWLARRLSFLASPHNGSVAIMTWQQHEITPPQRVAGSKRNKRKRLSKAEIERRRRKREQREQQVRKQLAGRLNNDNAVLTREEWRVLNHLSERTGRRILSGPPDKRPKLTQLSPQRDGITTGNNKLWQASRAR